MIPNTTSMSSPPSSFQAPAQPPADAALPLPSSTPSGPQSAPTVPSSPASVAGTLAASESPESPERTVTRKPSCTTDNSHAASTSGSSTVSNLPSMRWVKTLQKLTTAKAGQAKLFAEARREHRKTHDDGHPADCHMCLDYTTRADAMMLELREMDKTLRDMEDSVVGELREYKAARRREKRARERERKRKEARQSAVAA